MSVIPVPIRLGDVPREPRGAELRGAEQEDLDTIFRLLARYAGKRAARKAEVLFTAEEAVPEAEVEKPKIVMAPAKSLKEWLDEEAILYEDLLKRPHSPLEYRIDGACGKDRRPCS